jgi:hypothetical protein
MCMVACRGLGPLGRGGQRGLPRAVPGTCEDVIVGNVIIRRIRGLAAFLGSISRRRKPHRWGNYCTSSTQGLPANFRNLRNDNGKELLLTPVPSLHIKYRTCCSSRRIWQGSAAIFGRLDSAGRWVTARYLVPDRGAQQRIGSSLTFASTTSLAPRSQRPRDRPRDAHRHQARPRPPERHKRRQHLFVVLEPALYHLARPLALPLLYPTLIVQFNGPSLYCG